MSWLGRILRPAGGREDLLLLKLRTTRFRQLLRSYGAFLALLEDAAEKQGGSFILDRQYVVSLAEQVAEIADGVAFDLNVLTSQRNLAIYERAGQLRGELRSLLGGGDKLTRASREEEAAPAVSPARLAAALSRSRVVCRERGQVACRGVAAGVVCNLGDGPLREPLQAGCVLVAGDLPSGHGALEAMGRAAALLLDRGGVAAPPARRARELRIPAIVGLGDATRLLPDGREVTVDADENVVYEGRIGELLDYDVSTRAASGEEPEYALLRSVRQAAFSLTLPADRALPAIGGCRTFHDLVHLAQTFAGDAMAALLTSRCGDAGTGLRLAGAPWCSVHVVHLGRPQGHGARGGVQPEEPSSRPLGALLQGLTSPEGGGGEASQQPPCAVEAVATEEHALAAMPLPDGFDLLDATASDAAEGNSVYCRFSPRGESGPGGARGELAARLLEPLGFVVSRTGREVTGWLRGLPGPETEDRVRAVGRLRARLAGRRLAGGGHPAAGPDADAFLGTG
jgi:pyruvate,water dikinase